MDVTVPPAAEPGLLTRRSEHVGNAESAQDGFDGVDQCESVVARKQKADDRVRFAQDEAPGVASVAERRSARFDDDLILEVVDYAPIVH